MIISFCVSKCIYLKYLCAEEDDLQCCCTETYATVKSFLFDPSRTSWFEELSQLAQFSQFSFFSKCCASILFINSVMRKKFHVHCMFLFVARGFYTISPLWALTIPSTWAHILVCVNVPHKTLSYLCCLTGFSNNFFRSFGPPNGAANGAAIGAGAGLSGCGGMSGALPFHDGEFNEVWPICL